MDEDTLINKDINICFFSGEIISEPNFNFFYNSKKHISIVSFWIQTESGFKTSSKNKKALIKVVAYDDKADLIYRNFNIYNRITFEGFLQEKNVVLLKLNN